MLATATLITNKESMKHFFYVTLLCVFYAARLAAQDQPSPAAADSIKGLVVSAADTIPLSGVTVTIKGTDKRAVTDSTGHYILPALSSTDTLVFSLSGYKSALTAVNSRQSVNIMLNKNDEGTGTPAVPDSTRAAVDSTRVAPGVAADSTRVTARDSTSTTASDSVAGKIRVTGTVTAEEDKTPIPGVSVLVKNTSTGVVTDVNGKYTIFTNTPDDVLVFSFVGLQSKEAPLNGQTTIDIALAEEGKVLKEVVVIGYGTMDRATLTSSVSTIGSEMIDKDPLAQRIAGYTRQGRWGASHPAVRQPWRWRKHSCTRHDFHQRERRPVVCC